jgi:methyl-accepting chemotaxis protein
MNRVSQRQLLAIGVLALVALVVVLILGVEQKTVLAALLYCLIASYLVLTAGGDGGTTEVVESVASAVRRMLDGRRPEPPRDAPPSVARLFEELAEAHDALKEARAGGVDKEELTEATSNLSAALRSLTDGVALQLNASDETARYIKEMTSSQREIAEHVEVLATSAEESSSSVIQMTATNEQVAGNIADLATSVRETVASIEEMAYSIKEVAKNVDALSLTAEETSSSMNEMDVSIDQVQSITAEETSSSMNEMDVSIDQVQSNANETARLSEEVAQDAERGAEAILKTIGEIYRITESSQEAVAVISNLGSRIDAIGQILNVIDDVAEQTNLLALNAAIIAAQAGEHGKGFAVVADEIKDLAERAGASTKEIADLIKTIQSESKNAILAVERGAQNVDRGVEVSNEAERALKKILESSQKSTNMVRAIARATVEQAKGSKQVTDAIGRIAATVQQIAAATAQQARGSELIMKSGEKMRTISQQVERSSQEQSRGSRQITQAMESINSLAGQLNSAQRTQTRGSERALSAAMQIEEAARKQDGALREISQHSDRVRRSAGS